MDKIIIIEE